MQTRTKSIVVNESFVLAAGRDTTQSCLSPPSTFGSLYAQIKFLMLLRGFDVGILVSTRDDRQAKWDIGCHDSARCRRS